MKDYTTIAYGHNDYSIADCLDVILSRTVQANDAYGYLLAKRLCEHMAIGAPMDHILLGKGTYVFKDGSALNEEVNGLEIIRKKKQLSACKRYAAAMDAMDQLLKGW